MRSARSSIALAVALAATGGCTVGPDFVRPTVIEETSFAKQPGDLPSHAFAGPVEVTWWQRFDDPGLVALIVRLLSQNIDLQTASERVLQARAQVRVTEAGALPRVDGTPTFTRRRESPNGAVVSNALPSPTAKLTFSEYQPQLSANWEIDLFGRIRRSVEASDATLEAQMEDRRSIALSAITDLAQNYFQVRQSQRQQQIVRVNIELVQQRGELIRQRIAEGAVSTLDSAQSASQLATVRQSLPDLANQEARLTNAIGLLLGEPPGTLTVELAADAGRQSPPPPTIAIGLPSDLIRRRPDVREAEARLRVATAQTGVAVASFYPSFSLTGTAGYDSLRRNNLFDWASRFFTVAPVLTLPIFHGGELEGTLELRQSQQREAALTYRKTVLQAWHDVDNALTAYSEAQRTATAALAADVANARALGLAQQQYQAGASDYIVVIAAQTTSLNSQIGVAQASGRVETTLVTLYKALGGGWEVAGDVPSQSSR